MALTSRLSATAGIRYTHEGKDIDNAGGRHAFEEPNPLILVRPTTTPIPLRTAPGHPRSASR